VTPHPRGELRKARGRLAKATLCTNVGQVWYDFINGTNNYPGRPHQITITGTQDSVFQRLRFVQSQMW